MNNLITNRQLINREAVKLFVEHNQFLKEFASDSVKIGSTLRIRLPNDYVIEDTPIHRLDVLYGYQYMRPEWAVQVDSNFFVAIAPAIISIKEAVVLGAAATIIKNPVVSRRFWAGWSK